MPDEQVDEDRSIEQIEDDPWGPAPSDATRLVATVHELRRKPLRSLDAEDLRMLVSQQVGLDAVVPRALTLLEQEPLLEGDFYPGDVLVAVLKVPLSYWRAHPAELAKLERILGSVDSPDLKTDIDAFRARRVTMG